MGTEKKDAGYRAAVTGARGLLKLLVYFFLLLVLAMAGKKAYTFGKDIFDQHALTEEAYAQTVVVEVSEGMGAKEVGSLLREKGLIKEELLVFQAQALLTGYSNKFLPGTYILKTSQTVEDMLEILSGKNTEGQPKSESSGQ